ncbi:MAG: hypothetical protein JXA57_09960 [Armatimonadetes bacterium]|nr:hypothetical protein [Armatimonadota bacterium]
MAGVFAAVSVSDKASEDELVVVGTLLPLDDRHGRDCERELRQDRGFEDALRPHEGNAGALEEESAVKDGLRKNFSVDVGLAVQELESK